MWIDWPVPFRVFFDLVIGARNKPTYIRRPVRGSGKTNPLTQNACVSYPPGFSCHIGSCGSQRRGASDWWICSESVGNGDFHYVQWLRISSLRQGCIWIHCSDQPACFWVFTRLWRWGCLRKVLCAHRKLGPLLSGVHRPIPLRRSEGYGHVPRLWQSAILRTDDSSADKLVRCPRPL